MDKLPNDLQERLLKNEWLYLQEKYPRVAFNIKPDRPRLDGRFPKMNLPTFGFFHLLQLEPYNAMPEQWDPEILSQYNSVITYNRKFYAEFKNRLKMHLITGCTFFNRYYECSKFVSYEEKINGVVCVNKLYTVPNNQGGHVVHKREEVMSSLKIDSMVKHVFAPVAWGGAMYQGPTEVYNPGHSTLLNLLAKYKFNLCFESLYHEYWSWDFMTERLFNCFEAKTVPIYWGCYNIEDWVPTDLFIDYRQFKGPEDLSKYLLNFPKDKYIQMIENAFEWNKTNQIGSVENLEKVLRQLD